MCNTVVLKWYSRLQKSNNRLRIWNNCLFKPIYLGKTNQRNRNVNKQRPNIFFTSK